MQFKTDKDIIYPYTFDSSNLRGTADKLFIPETLEELSAGLSELYEANSHITISGAGTGITGARVPNGGVVISLERFKNIKLTEKGTVIVGSAVTLDELDIFLQEKNLFLPPNPTEINASIGGNVATNASGARTFKYGPIRDYVIGLKLFFANSDLLDIKRGDYIAVDNELTIKSNSGKLYAFQLPTYKMPDVKNASGYYSKQGLDAIDVFIGSEGTLSIIAEIELKVISRPQNVLGGIVFFHSSNKLLDFVNNIKELSLNNNSIEINLNDKIAARLIEYFDDKSLKLLSAKYPEIPNNAIGAIWFEQEYNINFEEKLMEDWYEIISEYTDLSDDTWFAMNDKEHLKLREFRHELPLQVYENLTNNSQKKVGLDTAVPNEHFDKLFNHYKEIFPKLGLEYVVFGHIGNCHLHANLFCKNDEEYILAKQIYDECIDLALKFKGTVSAEHGIGKLKKSYLVKMYGEGAIDEMRNIKKVFDNKLQLNIGTMFDM